MNGVVVRLSGAAHKLPSHLSPHQEHSSLKPLIFTLLKNIIVYVHHGVQN